ncbi:MAG TPA: GNAT family N-acetyltransferase, partial [Methanocella sp.]|uniref:GNAT family N-acetyltransferase n=1 Tax=Methanocella sp. TaxID=2052833 RepID=UPI002CCFD330
SVELIGDQALWDEFVERSPYGLLFHRWDFLRIMEKHTRYQLFPYGIYRGNELICIFPLFYRYYNGLNMVFSPPPLTSVPYLGPVMAPVYDTVKQKRKEIYGNAIGDEIDAEIKKFMPNYTSIITAPEFIDVRPFKWNGYGVENHYTYVIDLRDPLGVIWKNFGKDCRERIKSFGKPGVKIEQSYDVARLYNMLKKLFNDQGMNLPLTGQAYLDDIFQTFPDNLKIHFLTQDKTLQDIEVSCEYKDTFRLLWGLSIINKKLYGNQEFATWELIKRAKESGYKKFEIVGANTQRFCTYQSKFNPSLEMFFTLTKTDLIGNLAQWSYYNLVRKKLI